jgi:Raf kinase inhibitor-like YbhB/YbcL family protein
MSMTLLLSLMLLGAPLELHSSAFEAGGAIPPACTCKGKNSSPDLEWSHGPAHTASFALIVDDPDAPGGTFVHWVLFNLPAEQTALEPAARTGTAGENGFGKQGYGGPCPPPGAAHHYHFHLYALDRQVQLKAGATAEALRAAIRGHVLAEDELTALFPAASAPR